MDEAQYKRQIERLKKRIQELEGQVLTDELTNVLSRRGLLDLLKVFVGEVDYQLKNPDRRQLLSIKSLSILYVDIDHFKQVNDTYGHGTGDEVLKQVSALIRDSLRGIDVVGRYGGEEILVGLIGADIEHAQQIAQNLRVKIEQLEVTSGTNTVRVTASFGVASMEAGLSLERLLVHADKVLYRAKANGRNRVEVYGE